MDFIKLLARKLGAGVKSCRAHLTLLVLLLAASALNAQTRTTVTGTVVDTEGTEVIGATVQIVGEEGRGTATNLDGEFTLANVPTNATLRISYIGMQTQDVPLQGRTTLRIVLQSDSELLDEVVVVGYGTQRRENLTGAVASVDVAKAFESRPVRDIGNALQGVTPGLRVTNISGGIGQAPTIKLRGNTGSVNAGSGTEPLILVDNVPVPNLSFINPNDVESISVLKDAASASIYGSRAAFGVILITTKKGAKGERTQVTYSNNFAWKTPTILPTLARSYDNAQAILDVASRGGETSVSTIGYNVDDVAVDKMRKWVEKYGSMSEEELGEMQLDRDFEFRNKKYFWYREFDPLKMFMKKWSPQQNHDLSIRGGTESTTYSIGLGFTKEEGPMRYNPDQNRRFTFTPSISTKLNDYFTFRAGVMYTHNNYEEPYGFSSGVFDNWYYLMRWPRFYPYSSYEGKPFRSAITEAQQAKMNSNKSNFIRLNSGVTYSPIENFDLNVDYTFTFLNRHKHEKGGEHWARDFFNTNDPLKYSRISSTAHNRSRETSSYGYTHVWKIYGTYLFNLGENHAFKVMGGFDAEESEHRAHSSQRRELVSLDMPEIALAVGDQYVDDSPYHNSRATAGFFGRINYSFMGRYLLELNARYDGSSKFPPGRRWGFFPSGSVGWRVSEEDFFAGLKPTFSDLKLRASFGSVGNQDVPANSFLSTMSFGTYAWLVDGKETNYFSSPNAISPHLTWERVSTYDVGLDARFFNNRLGLTLDWYRRITSDMHSPGETLPATFGQSVPKVNEGELTATGFEVMLDFNHEFENGLNITASANFSTVKEVITKYKNDSKNIYGFYEGKVLGEIWGYETDRFFTDDDFTKDASGKLTLKEGIPSQKLFENDNFAFGPGDVKYKDLNGDGVINYGANTLDNHGDLKVIGNTLPNFEYGFSLGASWYGVDMSLFFQGVGKRNLWPVGSVGTPGFSQEAWFDHQMDYWTPNNPDAFYPKPSNNSWNSHGMNFLRQTKYLLNLGYLRLKNLTIGYSLPQSLIQHVGLQQFRVYVSGENLFEIYKSHVPVDPEVSAYKVSSWADGYSLGRTVPFQRTLSVGAQISF